MTQPVLPAPGTNFKPQPVGGGGEGGITRSGSEEGYSRQSGGGLRNLTVQHAHYEVRLWLRHWVPELGRLRQDQRASWKNVKHFSENSKPRGEGARTGFSHSEHSPALLHGRAVLV